MRPPSVPLDEYNILKHLITPAERIITEKVIKALLGAITLQMGTITVTIARYPFSSGQP